MTLAVLHRRLVAGLALSALLAYAVGAGFSAGVVLVAALLAAATVRLPPPAWGRWIELAARVGIVSLCAWMLYVAFALRLDFMPAVMAMLLFLLVAECLRPLDAQNDTRLYLLAFSLLLAGTAFYPGIGFAVAFVAFVALATLALTVGHLRRESERHGAASVVPGRRLLAIVGTLSMVTILVSVTLFVLFPRLPRQWNVQGRGAAGEVMPGFTDQVRLGQHGGRIGDNPEIAFRVEFLEGDGAAGATTYWRGRSFDRFDGERWTRSPLLALPWPGTDYAARWATGTRRVRIFGGPPGANVLFGSHAVVRVDASSAIRVYREGTGDLLFGGSDAPVYSVVSTAAQPPEAALRVARPRPLPNAALYLQLPELDPAVRRLADSLTSGHAGMLDRVRAVERYLSAELEYSLDLPSSRRDATIEGFLFRRRAGHCEYFSSAMVVLLRAAGIPSRNVTGFAGGEWNQFGSYLAVTGNQAHSWVEVWFGELGWVGFDPTPASRELLTGAGAAGGWWWPIRFWIDGVEHRWYKWVLDYNLDRQGALLGRLGDLLSRDGDGPGGSRGDGLPPWVAVAIAGAALGGVLWRARGWRPERRRAETRLYLALRRAYAGAGIAGSVGPLDFTEELVRRGAPGAADADALVALYLRGRFAGSPSGPAEIETMRASLHAARGALRRSRRAVGVRRSFPAPRFRR